MDKASYAVPNSLDYKFPPHVVINVLNTVTSTIGFSISGGIFFRREGKGAQPHFPETTIAV
jgi:hypothetical protein